MDGNKQRHDEASLLPVGAGAGLGAAAPHQHKPQGGAPPLPVGTSAGRGPATPSVLPATFSVQWRIWDWEHSLLLLGVAGQFPCACSFPFILLFHPCFLYFSNPPNGLFTFTGKGGSRSVP